MSADIIKYLLISLFVWSMFRLDVASESMSSLFLAKYNALEKTVHRRAILIAQMKKDHKERMSQIETELNELKATSQNQQSQLKMHLARKDKKVELLETQVNGLKKTVLDQDKEIASTNTRVVALNTTATSIIQESQNGQNFDSVAFSMRYNTGYKIQKDKPLIFFDQVFNSGQGYDLKDGVFKAPVRGVYAFHLVIGMYSVGDEIRIQLRVNGVNKALLYAHDVNKWDQSSQTAILSLYPGDRLVPFVTSFSSDSKRLAIKNSVFSGFLLYKL